MSLEGGVILAKMRAFNSEHGYIVLGSTVPEPLGVQRSFMIFPGEKVALPIKCLASATLEDAKNFAAACGTEIVSPAPCYFKAVVVD